MAKITLADGMTIEGTAEELRELAEVFGEVAEEAEKIPKESLVGKYVLFHENHGGAKAGEYYEITETGIISERAYVVYEIDEGIPGSVPYPPSESSFDYEIVDEKSSVQAATEPAEEATPEEAIEEGDVVRVIGETYYGDLPEGTIAIVSYFDDYKTSKLARIVIETEDDIDRTSAENLELVAKRADRKDLAE